MNNWASLWKPFRACLEDNNGCEHYCTVDKYLRPYCLCKNDFVLAKDEKSCRQNCQFRLTELEGIISSTGTSKLFKRSMWRNWQPLYSWHSNPSLSPNYPEEYNNDDLCEWEFEAPDGWGVEFFNFSINIAQSDQCHEDYLKIHDKYYCGYRQLYNLNFDAAGTHSLT